MAKSGALSRGHIKQALIRELAAQEKSQAQLAREYGVTPGAITQFVDRNRARIDEVRGKLDDEFAGLWIARKAARLAEYQEMVDGAEPQAKRSADWARVIQTALKSAAEELGQLPTRNTVHISGETVHYTVEGINVEDLR